MLPDAVSVAVVKLKKDHRKKKKIIKCVSARSDRMGRLVVATRGSYEHFATLHKSSGEKEATYTPAVVADRKPSVRSAISVLPVQ